MSPRSSVPADHGSPVATSTRRGRIRAQLNGAMLLVALVVLLPVIAISERSRRGAGRRVAQRGIRLVAALAGVRFKVIVHGRGVEVDGIVLVPNHSSPLDIAAVLVARPQARFFAAQELFRIPLLGSAARALGSVPINRHDPGANHARLDQIADTTVGEFAVFAEGGIRHDGLGEFKSGAFRFAIRNRRPVVPVAILGTRRELAPRRLLTVFPGTIEVHVGAAIPTKGLTLSDVRTLRDDTRTAVANMLRVDPAQATV